MTKVAVLMGGISREREISLRSGKNVCQALRQNGYEVKEVIVNSKDITAELNDCDKAFISLHGEFGEDGQVQQLLESIAMPYTGSGPRSSADCMDKVITKNILLANELPTPQFEVVSQISEITIAPPLVLKANNEGSSYGVFICHDRTELEKYYQVMKKDYPDFFIEKYIKGPEITVGVIKYRGKIHAYPILELVPQNEFYDFEAKYTAGMTSFIIPARLPAELSEQIKQQSIKAYQALKCEGAIRVDFIVQDSHKPYITEINTIPGMTDQSDLPAVAAAEDIAFAELVEMILSEAGLGKY